MSLRARITATTALLVLIATSAVAFFAYSTVSRIQVETIDQAVTTLVDTIGAGRTRLMSSVTQESDPTEGDSGFTATVEGLAGCLLALTASPDRRALVIDRATFQGADAGIVVVPVGLAARDDATPFDRIDVWVVTPDCGTSADPVVWHGTLSLP